MPIISGCDSWKHFSIQSKFWYRRICLVPPLVRLSSKEHRAMKLWRTVKADDPTQRKCGHSTLSVPVAEIEGAFAYQLLPKFCLHSKDLYLHLNASGLFENCFTYVQNTINISYKFSHRPNDRGSKHFWNGSQFFLPLDYTALQPRRQPPLSRRRENLKILHILRSAYHCTHNLFVNIDAALISANSNSKIDS
jgi:hypothetical protein